MSFPLPTADGDCVKTFQSLIYSFEHGSKNPFASDMPYIQLNMIIHVPSMIKVP